MGSPTVQISAIVSDWVIRHTEASRKRRANALKNTPTFVQTSVKRPAFERSSHWRARRYIRKSKTEMLFARMSSLYGFLDMESRGAESSVGVGVISVPNQDRFFSFETWSNEDSSSSYCTRASSNKVIPSNDVARLSCWSKLDGQGKEGSSSRYTLWE